MSFPMHKAPTFGVSRRANWQGSLTPSPFFVEADSQTWSRNLNTLTIVQDQQKPEQRPNEPIETETTINKLGNPKSISQYNWRALTNTYAHNQAQSPRVQA